MDRIEVFISSSMNELEYDREVACDGIKSIELNSHMFEMFPSMSESPAEVYLEKVKQCDIFILLLWKSYTTAVAAEYNEAIKRNKPILIFLKDLKDGEKRSTNLKIFIDRINSGSAKATVYKTYRSIKFLEAEIKRALSNEISRNYALPKITQTRQELYELGGTIVNQAYNRLFICEKTPCLFLGSRNYLSDSNHKIAYEEKMVLTLQNWIEINKTIDHTEFLYLFSPEKTKLELNALKQDRSYIQKIKNTITKYKEYEESTGYRFRFLPISLAISGFMMIGDVHYVMWFLGEATALSQRSEKISNELANQLKRSHDIRMTQEDIFNILEL